MEPQYAYQTAPMNIPMMAGGGLPAAAKQVESQGRNGDSMLMHVSPGEVKGLNAIAQSQGTSLSTNPNTGLPEAFKLKSLIPMIAGLALAPMTAGTSLAFLGTPMGAGLAVGGIEALRTKSLSKGLMAGLGAAGGAGLGGALSTAGQAASSAAATSAIPANATAAGVTGPMAPTVSGLDAMKLGAQNLTNEAGRAAFTQAAGGPLGLASTAFRAASPAVGGMMTPEGKQDPANPQANIRPFTFDAGKQDDFRSGEPGEATSEIEYFKPKFTPLGVYKPGQEPAYGTYAQGGGVAFDYPDGYQDYNNGGAVAFAKGGLEDGGFVVPADVVAHLGNGSNEAGQEILAKGLGAKPIRGDGDGMSDSIKTTIEGEQDARVADGEAYIPAEVVKKVGPQRLYAMLDKIRKARTGRESQAPEIEPEEYMPA